MRMFNNNTSGLPTVQLLEVKHRTPEMKYCKMIISDGQHWMQAVLATELNSLVTNGQVCDDPVCAAIGAGRALPCLDNLGTPL